jgi:hypothetical protein
MPRDSQLRAIDDMRPLGDRRGRIRLEVVGLLWGTLEVSNQARVVNISSAGALIDSPVPAVVESTQAIWLTLHGYQIKLRARVRHLSRIVSAGGDETSYRIGLEFLEQPASLLEALG